VRGRKPTVVVIDSLHGDAVDPVGHLDDLTSCDRLMRCEHGAHLVEHLPAPPE